MSQQDMIYAHIYINLTDTYWDKGSLDCLDECHSLLHDDPHHEHHRCHKPQRQHTRQWSRLPVSRPEWGTWTSCWWRTLACLNNFSASVVLPLLVILPLVSTPLTLHAVCDLWGECRKWHVVLNWLQALGRPMKRETIEVGTVTACCTVLEWVSSLLLLMSIKNSVVNAKK